MRVKLRDGRVVVGTLVAYQGSGDILLRECVEQRFYNNDEDENHPNNNTNNGNMAEREVAIRGIDLLAIPFKYIETMHRRKEGQQTIWQEFSAQLERVEAH
ncbi:unnamed protein product [Phytomonas sp. Hart1]|nr:unnamed protein product [Phytomonas sp. Hart1]|eukprot:CCW71762.1 unnamed protein product [Phytomonas sp. isolate Hart1]